MSKHTPGPWIVGGKYTVRTPFTSSDWICRTRDERHGHDDNEDEANARLISAAPELLEALKELLDKRCTSMDIVGYDPQTGHPLNAEGMAALNARAAIAKAEGRDGSA